MARGIVLEFISEMLPQIEHELRVKQTKLTISTKRSNFVAKSGNQSVCEAMFIDDNSDIAADEELDLLHEIHRENSFQMVFSSANYILHNSGTTDYIIQIMQTCDVCGSTA